MSDSVEPKPGRAERAMISVLCALLPQGFSDRQRGEWTADVVSMAGSGAAARWRYLLAAAWTLPALRAHARKPGVDRPQATVSVNVPAAKVARVVVIGLGLPMLCWLIAVPLRWYLLDIPSRLQGAGPFDPKDLWPTEGLLIALVPLWVAMSIAAWAVVFGLWMLCWIAIVAAVSGLDWHGNTAWRRALAALLGLVLIAVAILGGPPFSEVGPSLMTGLFGVAALVFGLLTRGLRRRVRVLVVLTGLLASGVFAFHLTPLGQAMLLWYMD